MQKTEDMREDKWVERCEAPEIRRLGVDLHLDGEDWSLSSSGKSCRLSQVASPPQATGPPALSRPQASGRVPVDFLNEA